MYDIAVVNTDTFCRRVGGRGVRSALIAVLPCFYWKKEGKSFRQDEFRLSNGGGKNDCGVFDRDLITEDACVCICDDDRFTLRSVSSLYAVLLQRPACTQRRVFYGVQQHVCV